MEQLETGSLMRASPILATERLTGEGHVFSRPFYLAEFTSPNQCL